MKTNNNIIQRLNENEILAGLEHLCHLYEKRIEKLSNNCHTVDGIELKVCRRNKSFQCYLVDTKTKKIKYAKHTDSTVKRIAQTEYNRKQVAMLKKKLAAISEICFELNNSSVGSVYDDLSFGRKQLVFPEELGVNELSEAWKKVEYEHKPFVSDEVVFQTKNGLRVRSKSEIMIAEELDRLEIPYRYEFPLKIGGVIYHPDFLILNEKTGREIIWEHFGLIDDSGYRDDTLRKIRTFESEGYTMGLDFVFTAETSRLPLCRSDILSVIKMITG